MAKEIFPSSYECDCGHQSHFFENTIRQIKEKSLKRRVMLGEGGRDGHQIVFSRGEMVEILCPRQARSPSPPLPEVLRDLFWEHDFDTLDWHDDRDLITSRVLAAGGWEAIRWLRALMGDDALRAWLLARRGRGLTPKQLRFWELILRLPHRQVNAWMRELRNQVWHNRLHG